MEMTSGIVLAAQFTSITFSTTLGNFFVIFLRLEIEDPRLNSRLAFPANPLISGIPSLAPPFSDGFGAKEEGRGERRPHVYHLTASLLFSQPSFLNGPGKDFDPFDPTTSISQYLEKEKKSGT